MFQVIRRHLNSTTVVAFAALVFAMTGGAFAATGGGGSSGAKASAAVTPTATAAKSKAKPKAKAGPRGPAGPQGKTGATGPAGAQGPQGAAGAAGAQGETGGAGGEGKTGATGAAGASVTSKQLTTSEAACNKEGGSEFTAGSTKTTACNGKEGSPWTVGGLPKGASEMGEWNIFQGNGDSGVGTAISFTVPLAKALAQANVHFIQEGETPPTGCEGTVKKPVALSGNLCVFAADMINVEAENPFDGAGSSVFSAFEEVEVGGVSEPAGADRAGVTMNFKVPSEGLVWTNGTWAVTG